MAKGLGSRPALAKEHNDKNVEVSIQVNEMQEHIRELFLKHVSHAKTEKKKLTSPPGYPFLNQNYMLVILQTVFTFHLIKITAINLIKHHLRWKSKIWWHWILGWIFKINQFFFFCNTSKEQRISIASFYMDGQALHCYQWMYNGQLNSWSNFLHSLQTRFQPSQFDNSQGALFKLTQTTSIREYQRQLESLSNSHWFTSFSIKMFYLWFKTIYPSWSSGFTTY